jgi:hypothetical protein
MSLTNQSKRKIKGIVSVELLLNTCSPLGTSWDPISLNNIGVDIVGYNMSAPQLFIVMVMIIMMLFTPRLYCAQAMLLLLNNSWALIYKLVTIQYNFYGK